MSEHTPPPWHVDSTDDGQIREAGSHTVARAWHLGPIKNQAAANARLIAAAPDMLAALDSIMGACAIQGDAVTISRRQLQACIVAVAKAKGEKA